jgi:hypothetical protein
MMKHHNGVDIWPVYGYIMGDSLSWGVQMVRRVVNHVWNDLVRDYLPAPLDDADEWTLSLANQINGRDLSDAEFALILTLFDAECGIGGLTS